MSGIDMIRLCSKQWEDMFEVDAAAYKIRAREVWAPRRRSWTAQRVCDEWRGGRRGDGPRAAVIVHSTLESGVESVYLCMVQ